MAEIEQLQIEQHNKIPIPEQWSEEVKILMEADVPDDRANLRLSKALKNAKPDAYIPQMVSLGPYHHFSLKDESVAGPFHLSRTHLSQMEVYKIWSARYAAGNDPQLIKNMFARVEESVSDFQKFYDCEVKEEDVSNFAWMMMVDALFLSYFLKSGFDDVDPPLESSVRRGASKDVVVPARASIRCDIVKLENQIPLSLLRKLEVIAKDPNSLDSLLPSISRRLSSFLIYDYENHDHFNGKREEHLLGCIHKHVSSFLRVSNVEESATWHQWIKNVIENVVAAVFSVCYPLPAKHGRLDFLKKYSAKELKKVGVKFESFCDEQGKIRFSKNSDTLYLPQITISDTYTEVLLRNLLALEFNESDREKKVSNYVELMDCLIDTPEDVKLLRESHVIERHSMMITDDYVAEMWDGMSKPFFLAGFLELPGGLKGQIREVLIKNYYKSKIKTQMAQLYSEYLSSPWKVVALLVGFFVLLLTVLQTYCSVHDCEIQRSPKANARKLFRHFG